MINRVKGLGLTSITTLIPESKGFKLFNSLAQVFSYSGYDVTENQSGSRTGTQWISKMEIAGSEEYYSYPL